MPFVSENEFTPNFYLNGHDSLIFVINTVLLFFFIEEDNRSIQNNNHELMRFMPSSLLCF